MLIEGWRRVGALGGGDQIRDCAAGRQWEVGASASVKIVLAAAKLVMEPGSLEIEVESDHAFAERGQEPCGVGKKQGAAYAALIGIEGYSLHGAQAARPKAPASRKRRARSCASRQL